MSEFSYEWVGPSGERKTGLTEMRAQLLVECRGGTVIPHEMVEAIPVEVAKPEYQPASGSPVGAEVFYGPNTHNGD